LWNVKAIVDVSFWYGVLVTTVIVDVEAAGVDESDL
jgi:hypothetical protein